MEASLSVIIASKNCVDRIEQTIQPWKGIAKEIIVVDQYSKDGTAEAAQNIGAIVIQNQPMNGNFDLNRKLGLEKASGQWLLYIDTDERPTAQLIVEIKEFLKKNPEDIDGVRIPNLFYFLGKALNHGIYNKRSAEIRLFRKDKWHYPCEAGFHNGVSVAGKVALFQSAYKHFNVNTLSEWFIKTNQYTEHDALKNYSTAKTSSVIASFVRFEFFFFKHYIFKLGFLDGWRGFLSILYFGLYHFTLRMKFLEKKELDRLTLEKDYLKPLRITER